MRVKIRDRIYDSVPEAAAALGVSKAAVYSGIARGKADKIGLGKRGPYAPSGGCPKVPLTVAGVRFESITALANAIGRPVRHVRTSLKAGPVARQRIALAVMRMTADQENAAMRGSIDKPRQSDGSRARP